MDRTEVFKRHSQWPENKDYLELLGPSESETMLTVHSFLDMCKLLGVFFIARKQLTAWGFSGTLVLVLLDRPHYSVKINRCSYRKGKVCALTKYDVNR